MNSYLLRNIFMNYLTGKWTEKTPLTTARSHCPVAAYDGKIYVFGGGGPEFSSLRSVAVYDTKNDTWETGRDMPSLRSGAVALTVGDRIYVIGGGFRQEDGIFRFLKDVEIYHPETDTWETGAEMLMPHDYPAVALLDESIYIMAGHHPDATRGGPKTDPGFDFCERLDLALAEQRWKEIAPLSTPRFALSSVVLDGKILSMGGVALTKEGFNNFDIIEIFEPKTEKWRREREFSLPWPAAGLGSCVLGGNIFIFGGYCGDSIHDRAAFYDVGNGAWHELPPMLAPAAAMGVAVVESTVYLIGGWAADGRTPLNTVSAYTLT